MGKGSTGGGTTLPAAIVPGTVLAAGADGCSDVLMDTIVDAPTAEADKRGKRLESGHSSLKETVQIHTEWNVESSE